MIRGLGKSQSTQVWDDFTFQVRVTVESMIERFRNNTAPTQGYFIPSRGGVPVPITIPEHTNFVNFLRLMYAEQGSGKLYLPRQVATWASTPGPITVKGEWDVVLWGGGRQKASKIKVVEVESRNVPKTLKLIGLLE